jgi:hypothetical protein
MGNERSKVGAHVSVPSAAMLSSHSVASKPEMISIGCQHVIYDYQKPKTLSKRI